MNYTDEEVDLIVAWNTKRKAFVAAKEARDAKPGDAKLNEAYETAKREMSDFRSHWRGIRDATRPVPDVDSPDALVAVGTIAASAESNEATAVAGKGE